MTLRPSLALALATAALAPVCSCSDGGSAATASGGTSGDTSGTGGGDGHYDAVTVEPKAVTLSVPLGGSATQSYQAFAIISGQKTDISDTCEWSVSQTFGSMSGATLTAADRGGVTQVTATCNSVTGSSDLTIDLTGTFIVGPSTPANAPEIFGAAQAGSDAARAPAILYPINGAVAPLNIPPIDVQWTAAQNDLFHVAFLSSHLAVNLYTTDLSGLLSEVDWGAVAGTAEGEDLTIQVEGLAQADPSMKFAGSGAKLTMSHDTIDKTALYYWASSQGSIMTQVFGTTTAPSAIKADCTSCHSVSRSGSRIGYSRCVGGDCNQLFAGFMRYSVQEAKWIDTVDANNKAISGSFTTFAPIGNPFKDDKQSVALLTQSPGQLVTVDPDTGAVLPSNAADVASHGPNAPRAALMPDWSPDGASVVFASTPHPGQYIDLSDGAIAVMSYAYDGSQHVFGEPSLIVSQPVTLPSGVYNNFFFPSYSPDGQFIVFNAARSAWRNSADAAAPGQRLMLTNPKGSWVADLTAANGEGDLDITWPHWAPGSTNDYLWIVFASQRPYGHKITPQNSAPSCIANGVKQCKQLWIAAIKRESLAGGEAPQLDPSAAPVWLPGQDIGADNISPFWTVPVTEIPQ